MSVLKTFISNFVRDDSGATAIEYGLLAGLLSLAIVGGATTAGTKLVTIFTNVGTDLTTASTSAH
jgi:pilus assembly protein Flp/PilA